MKAKVLKRFRDKYSGKCYKVGEVIVISKERFEEIQKVDNLVEEVKDTKKAKNTAE